VRKLEERAVGPGHKQLAQSWARRRREYDHETDIIDEAIQRLDRMVANGAAE
jgi:hypothetical protein